MPSIGYFSAISGSGGVASPFVINLNFSGSPPLSGCSLRANL